MTRKEKKVAASEPAQKGKEPERLIAKIILVVVGGLVFITAMQMYDIQNSTPSGALEDFADSAEKGLADYKRAENKPNLYLSENCRKVRTEQGDSAINDRPECF